MHKPFPSGQVGSVGPWAWVPGQMIHASALWLAAEERWAGPQQWCTTVGGDQSQTHLVIQRARHHPLVSPRDFEHIVHCDANIAPYSSSPMLSRKVPQRGTAQ